MHTRMHACTHKHKHKRAHTHTHTHTHTQWRTTNKCITGDWLVTRWDKVNLERKSHVHKLLQFCYRGLTARPPCLCRGSVPDFRPVNAVTVPVDVVVFVAVCGKQWHHWFASMKPAWLSVQTFVCVCVCVRARMQTHTCMCVCMCVHTCNMCAYMHKHTRTCVRVCVRERETDRHRERGTCIYYRCGTANIITPAACCNPISIQQAINSHDS